MLVNGFLEYFTRAYRDSDCLYQGEKALTYGQFDGRVLEYAKSMQAHGVVARQRVAVLSENSIEQLILFYACLSLGAVYLPLNFRLAPKELEYIIADADASLLFVGSRALLNTVRAMDASKELRVVALECGADGDEISAVEFLVAGQAVALAPVLACENDTVYQMYTSGTTGRPKGVMISHRQLASFLSAYAAMPPHQNHAAPHLAVAPLFHAAAFTLALAALCVGRPVVIMPQFNPQEVLLAIDHHRVADTLLVPAMLQAVVAAATSFDGDLTSLKCVTYGGSPISASQLEQSVKVLQCDFQQGFGMTEMVTGVIWLTPEDHRVALSGRPELLQSCGRAAPFNQVKVVDPVDGSELAVREVGEILLRGEQMMQGYWRQPEKTAQALKGGWYHSGDAGFIDEEGFLYIKDRLKDMIVSGGENVYPAEVEAALMAHKAVVEVAVVGVPDERFGEAVVACVVFDGAVASEVAHVEAELIDFCRSHIAGYKIPRRYHPLEQLPRNAAGKVLKHTLRDILAQS